MVPLPGVKAVANAGKAPGVACHGSARCVAWRACVSPLEAMKVLVVEDEFLIATDLGSMLRKLGASEVRIELSIGAALAGLLERLPDCAVLDIGLREETPERIADFLLQQRVPFIFATGYDNALPLPDRLRAVPLVRKPVNAVDLEDAFARAFALVRD